MPRHHRIYISQGRDRGKMIKVGHQQGRNTSPAGLGLPAAAPPSFCKRARTGRPRL
jgi:hypothetical protein